MQAKKQNILTAYKESSCEETKDTLKRLYPKVDFEKKLADSWGEYCEMVKKEDINYHTHFLEILPDKFVVFYRLHELRDHYNDGVNYCDKYDVISIVNKMGNIKIEFNPTSDNFLSFKDTETAERFLKNFGDLIERAEDLI